MTVDLSSDPAASDNPNLVFRVQFAGNNSGSTGFVRIDNVSVTGPVGQVPVPGAPTLVHYWYFPEMATAVYHIPNVPNLHANYSAIDTTTAYLNIISFLEHRIRSRAISMAWLASIRVWHMTGTLGTGLGQSGLHFAFGILSIRSSFAGIFHRRGIRTLPLPTHSNHRARRAVILPKYILIASMVARRGKVPPLPLTA